VRSFGVVTHLSGLTRITEAQRAAARQSVKSGAAMTGAYLGMNAAATLIAGFGLLENSPAVIIGAMLIAMLFGPIVGIALGLAEADMALLGRSIVSEVIGAAWVLVIASGIGLVFRGSADRQRDPVPHIARDTRSLDCARRWPCRRVHLLCDRDQRRHGGRRYRDRIGPTADDLRHPAGPRIDRTRDRRVSAVSRQLRGHLARRHGGFSFSRDTARRSRTRRADERCWCHARLRSRSS